MAGRGSESEGGDPGESFISTVTGERLYPFDPDPAHISIQDVATGLANTCRFGGQTTAFYSVARHSVFVSQYLAQEHGPRIQLLGLLHDSAEAYLPDLAAPIKQHLTEYQAVEEDVLQAVWEAFDVEPPTDTEQKHIKAADTVLLDYEAHELLADSAWAGPAPALEFDVTDGSPQADRSLFLDRFRTLETDL